MEATGQSMQIDLGHWLLRLIAYVIDAIIISVIAVILWVVLILPFLFMGIVVGDFFGWAWIGAFPFLVGILLVLYVFYAEVNWGGTLGKRILGLRVQTVSGGRITYSQSFIRNISKIHPLFLLLDWLIGIATPGDRRQKYTDRIAGVTVVQANAPATASLAQPPPSQ
jgi:uncharacterized RDD family membrane protein YckC